MCAMPRANPPPRATPIPGVLEVDSEAAESRESSLPKAWTDRMIPLNDFTGAPLPVTRNCLPHLPRKMPFVGQMVQTTLVPPLVIGELLVRRYLAP